MSDFFQWDDGSVDGYDSTDVGPQTGGTYSIPTTAQPTNQPWDVGGGTLGNYGSGIVDILKAGIGAWSMNQSQNNLLDYKRYEATSGGLYTQGVPAGTVVRTTSGTSGMSIMLMGALVLGAVLLLKKA